MTGPECVSADMYKLALSFNQCSSVVETIPYSHVCIYFCSNFIFVKPSRGSYREMFCIIHMLRQNGSDLYQSDRSV